MFHGIRRSRAAVLIAAAAFGGATATCVVSPLNEVFADEVDDLVSDLKSLVAEGDDSKIAARVATFEKRKEKRIDDLLLVIARTSRLEASACAAMRVLGMHQDPGYLGWMKSKLYDKKMLEERPSQYCAMLDSLPPAGDALKPYLKDLSNCITEYMKTRPDVTTRAVTAYGAVHDKSVVLPLIAMLEKTETDAGGGGGGKGRQAPQLDASGMGGGGGSDFRGNLQSTGNRIIEVLKSLTGGEGGNSREWKNWWYTNEKSVRFPSPEPAWATISEFSDDWYGLVLKKPSVGALWGFEKCQFAGGRARLKCQDGTALNACVDVMTYPKGSIQSVQEFAQSVDEAWRRGEFAEFTEKGEPVVTKKRIGGREFAVVAARGTGAGSWKDWEGVERRVYVTMGDPNTVLALEAAVRESFDPAQKAAFWSALEGVAFKPVK